MFFDKVVLGDAQPLGEVVDYFWRVKFQERGSPHIHGLLWIKDAPNVVELSESESVRTELAEYVDQFISVSSRPRECDGSCLSTQQNDILTRRPPQLDDVSSTECALAAVVQRVQQHRFYEGAPCRRNNACRFGFPKPVQKSTSVTVDRAGNGALRVNVNCMREDSNTNNYNDMLLQTWRANMDVKLIGNAYGAAEYTAAYVSKSEPDTSRFRDAIMRAVSRTPPMTETISALCCVANASISIREVSAQEALWILLNGLPMWGRSRTVMKVKATRHSRRYYRVEPCDCLHQLKNTSQLQGRMLWESIDAVCFLCSQKRGKQDSEWYAVLSQLRKMEYIERDVALFNTRYSASIEHGWTQDATYITYRNTDVDAANSRLIDSLSSKVFTISSVHEVKPNSKNGDVCQSLNERTVSMAMNEAGVKDRDHDKVIAPTIRLGIGVPVAITFNIEQRAGLCSGTKAEVYDFMTRPNRIPIVLARMKDKYIGLSFLKDVQNIVPIVPHSVSWTCKDQSARVTRTGLLLRSAHAMTIHKVQELTCSKLIFDPTKIPSSAFAYVALSRVTHRDNLIITRILSLPNTAGQRKLREVLVNEWRRMKSLAAACR